MPRRRGDWQLLLDWPLHAPQATCLQGRAFVEAAEYPGILRMLYMSVVRALQPAAGAVAGAGAAGKERVLAAGAGARFSPSLQPSEVLTELEIKMLAQSMASVAEITLPLSMVLR